MLGQNDNDLLTRVGAQTPMGELMRRYWLPALLAEEIPAPDCPPVRVRLLGEDLVASIARTAALLCFSAETRPAV
jgi:phthalate 4,5-dioxygenase oxygenase subunit